MIKDENGVLVGYVFADIDETQRDLGGWVDDAKALVAAQLKLPVAYRLQWTGQYEFQVRARERLKILIPLVFFIIFMSGSIGFVRAPRPKKGRACACSWLPGRCRRHPSTRHGPSPS